MHPAMLMTTDTYNRLCAALFWAWAAAMAVLTVWLVL